MTIVSNVDIQNLAVISCKKDNLVWFTALNALFLVASGLLLPFTFTGCV